MATLTRFANRLQATIGRVIRINGTTATIERRTVGAYEPGTGAVGVDGSLSQSIPSLWRESFDLAFAKGVGGGDGTVVRSKQRRLVVLYKELAFDPLAGDKVVVQAETFRIANDGIIRRFQNDAILYLELVLENA